jgi:hypothetical protein
MLAHIQSILQDQLAIVQFQGGVNGPLVTLPKIYNTLAKKVENAGLKSAESYFDDPANAEQQQPPQQPKPDPKMIEAQANIQAKQAEAQAAAQTKAAQAQADMAIEAQKAQQQMALEREKAALAMQIEREKAALQLELAREKMRADIEMQREKNQVGMAVQAATAMQKPAASEATP